MDSVHGSTRVVFRTNPREIGDFFLVLFCIFENILYLWSMSNELIFVLIFFWVVSAAYVMYTTNKRLPLSLDIIIVSILLGPILALFVNDIEHTTKKHHEIEENENERHRRWFRTMGEINRERTPTWFRTIPPPPPISRVERAMSERDEAIRSARERIDKNKIPKFKFLRG